ncbi:EamA family transporter [Bacillus atrophaeus]|uniref:DMT family transporter n=1 Tax=Bacillus atrophaeus TaxID=1452 RepID=UPI00077AF15E|nr:EamA family transporter [Bacillus atrophaeus]KXZ19177.1 transporter [Bacillus atrophaeus]MCY8908678.1 EamA family transporter [Bacillus atrophaeus]MCY8915232.1 EamA family transporter [Bacillus atrophaeus]MCY8921067.1 EamA family transporter [Bacillus atrophaeus]MCY8924731.1 EamA family transporter [Bacillus atrophaeus]
MSNLLKYRVYLLFCLACLIGGTTWAVQKAGLQDSLPFWSAGMRFLIASVLIAAFLLIRKQFVVTKELVVLAVLNGVMYFSIPFGSVYWASQYLPSGLVSILAASISVFALVINRIVKGTPATALQKWGIVLAVIGMTIVFGNQLFIQVNVIEIVAMAVILCAMVGSAFITIQVQKRIRSLPVLSFNSISMLSGGLILLISSLLIEDGTRTFSSVSLYAVLYLAIVGSVLGFWINIYLLKHWHISKATSHLFISPVIALYIGFIFLQEALNLNIYIGTFFVITGVMCINLRRERIKKDDNVTKTLSNHVSK